MRPETGNRASVTTDPIRNQGPTPGASTMVLFPHHPTPGSHRRRAVHQAGVVNQYLRAESGLPQFHSQSFQARPEGSVGVGDRETGYPSPTGQGRARITCMGKIRPDPNHQPFCPGEGAADLGGDVGIGESETQPGRHPRGFAGGYGEPGGGEGIGGAHPDPVQSCLGSQGNQSGGQTGELAIHSDNASEARMTAPWMRQRSASSLSLVITVTPSPARPATSLAMASSASST